MTVYSAYVLCNKGTNQPIYAGMTKNTKTRNSRHKYRCNTPSDPGYNFKLYQHIRANGGFDNFDMVVVSTHRTRSAALKKERKLIQECQMLCNVVHKKRG
jgi:predicted GIY-YIG superfamily endonuclease